MMNCHARRDWSGVGKCEYCKTGAAQVVKICRGQQTLGHGDRDNLIWTWTSALYCTGRGHRCFMAGRSDGKIQMGL